jgi:putative ATP-dependent endonuclease of OLD family
MNVPVAIVTDVDVREYDKTPKLDEEGRVAVDKNGKTIYVYPLRATEKVSEEKELKTTAKETEYNSQRVKAFVAPRWTFEYCLLRSSSLSDTFKTVFKKVHSMVDENNIEQELAKKLINKTLNKTEIAYRLAQVLEEDANRDLPEITLDENDDAIKYLIGAVKHACRC